MKKVIFFLMLLFTACIVHAALSVCESPPGQTHPIINDNYMQNVDITAIAQLQPVALPSVVELENTEVSEVTIITYTYTARENLSVYIIKALQTKSLTILKFDVKTNKQKPISTYRQHNNFTRIYIDNCQLALK